MFISLRGCHLQNWLLVASLLWIWDEWICYHSLNMLPVSLYYYFFTYCSLSYKQHYEIISQMIYICRCKFSDSMTLSMNFIFHMLKLHQKRKEFVITLPVVAPLWHYRRAQSPLELQLKILLTQLNVRCYVVKNNFYPNSWVFITLTRWPVWHSTSREKRNKYILVLGS